MLTGMRQSIQAFRKQREAMCIINVQTEIQDTHVNKMLTRVHLDHRGKTSIIEPHFQFTFH